MTSTQKPNLTQLETQTGFEHLHACSSQELNQLISHELRTPLTSIQGALRLLQVGYLSSFSQKSQRLLDIALNNTNRLIRLTQAIENQPVPSASVISSAAMARFRLETELQKALKREEFVLFYQPIVETQTCEIIGFEALIRWQHPTRGLVSPVEFIPLAEDIGLIHPIGLWVLREACRQLQTWQQQMPHYPPLSVSVNLSTLQLSQPNLVEQVDQILQQTQLPASSLRLEITESAFLENSSSAIATLERLKSLGVQLYIDDFGTGYSCLGRLQDWPIDVLKIDQTFIRTQKWNMIQAIMLLAKSLNVDVIVEGVETSEDLAQLQQLGCQYAQGYFFSHPVDATAARQFITQA